MKEVCPISHDVAVVLTAAILVAPGSTAVENMEVRRRQYIEAARYYSRFAPVYLLEHSGYDLFHDAEFLALEGVFLREIAPPDRSDRGKGYREFHGLDVWYRNETAPPQRILKITGRYIVANIGKILSECRKTDIGTLLFDRYFADEIAVTSIFSISWRDYGKYLSGQFSAMNDFKGLWAEHIVFRAVAGGSCRFFRYEPDVGGISGSSNADMRIGRFKYRLKQGTRMINMAIDPRFLYFRGHLFHAVKSYCRNVVQQWI